MKKSIVLVLSALLFVALFTGCEDDPKKEEAPVTAAALYVLNSGGQSISVVDILENQVYNNVATVGTWPNQLLYKDGMLYCVNSGSNNIMIFDVDDFFFRFTKSEGFEMAHFLKPIVIIAYTVH